MCVYMQHMYIHTCSALMFHTYKNIHWGGNPMGWKSLGGKSLEIQWG